NPLRLQDRNASAQPAPFKDSLSVLINAWKRPSVVEYTRNGNPHPPPVRSCMHEAWRDTP
ncbi:hypothetical protein F441_15168, partial [Phytophthora nicotianae CJ01A1]